MYVGRGRLLSASSEGGQVRYTVTPNSFSSSHDHTLTSGLSGLNPPTVHTIRLVK